MWNSRRRTSTKLRRGASVGNTHGVSIADLPAQKASSLLRAQIPLFLLNAAVLGAAWGVLRLRGGSILVSSVSHGLWNGLAYALFGYGTKVGALGIARTDIYGPDPYSSRTRPDCP